MLRLLYVHERIRKFPDEAELIKYCIQKDTHAQRTLYERYFKVMLAVCLRYLKNEEDAIEVLNNAFLKVFTRLKQFKSEGSMEGWIKRIVINSAIDYLRRNKTYRNKFILTDIFSNYSLKNDSDNIEQDEHLLDKITAEEIFELVKELPTATRVVFNLYVIDQHTHVDISKELRISIGTSKWHLSNARKILKAKIIEHLNRYDKASHGTRP